MYPPQEHRADYHAPDPVRSCIVSAALVAGIGLVISAANRSALSGVWLFVLAAIEGIDATLIRFECRKVVRVAIRVACVLTATAAWWLMWRS